VTNNIRRLNREHNNVFSLSILFYPAPGNKYMYSGGSWFYLLRLQN